MRPLSPIGRDASLKTKMFKSSNLLEGMVCWGIMTRKKQLEVINSELEVIKLKRNKLLSRIRRSCNHNRLVECLHGVGSRPFRVCMDCGAQENGWGCGYHVLATDFDTTDPRGKKRAIFKQVSFDEAMRIRDKHFGLYLVGQSHSNFEKGKDSYKELTEC